MISRAENIPYPAGSILEKNQWHNAVELAAQRFTKDGTPLSVLFIDVNYFKDINDTLGHEQGDRVIADIRNLLVSQLRTSNNDERAQDILSVIPTRSEVFDPEHTPGIEKIDLVPGHVGGDEFALLCETDDKGIMLVTDRIKTAFNAYVGLPGNEALKELGVSLAIGASVMQDGMTVEELLSLADNEMYQDKLSQLKRLAPEQEQRLYEIFDELDEMDVRWRDLGKYALVLGWSKKN